MSDTETSVPATEALFEVVGSSDAAVARVDQAEAALRDMTSDRDSWQSAAENLRTELWRQMDMMRAEHVQHGEQIAHLSAAMNALIEIAESRQATHVAEVDVEPVAEVAVAPVVAAEPEPEPLPTVVRLAPDTRAPIATPAIPDTGRDPFKVNAPAAVVVEPVAEVAPAEVAAPVEAVVPVEAVAPVKAPAPVVNVYVPADDSKDVGHLAAQVPDEISEPVIVEGDRVGVFTELAAFADHSEPEFGLAAPGPAKPEEMNVLPTPVVEAPKKRQLRLPRLSG